MESPIERILELVTNSLNELKSGNTRLNTVLSKATRIARLRNDYVNLFWLDYEMISFQDTETRTKLKYEIGIHFKKDDFSKLRHWVVESFINERKCKKLNDEGELEEGDHILGLSISEIESTIDSLKVDINKSASPAGLHPIDLYELEIANQRKRDILMQIIQEYQNILGRISFRIHEFLSITEHQLIYGQFNSDLFEKNRQYVDAKLKQISEDTSNQLEIAYKRLLENDPESRSHALTSCRRALKSIADKLYPPQANPIKGSDGKERILNDEKFISRLWQFVSDRGGKSGSGKLLLVQIKDLGDRIDAIYNLTCKGVHSEISSYEANQCMIQTYLIMGDILRLEEQDSSITIVEEVE